MASLFGKNKYLQRDFVTKLDEDSFLNAVAYRSKFILPTTPSRVVFGLNVKPYAGFVSH